MTLSYSLRLVVLSLACLAAVDFAVAIVLRCFAARAIRRAEKMDARTGARFLFVLRLLPPVCALFAVAGLCVPSYLWLEPEFETEQASTFALVAAICGATVFAYAIGRGAMAAFRSARYVRQCEKIGEQVDIAEAPARSGIPVIVIPNAGRVVALAGLKRGRLIVSAEVAEVLEPAELRAAMRHELAHHASHDNWKRLAMAITPGWFLRPYESAWKRMAEWAADDRAALNERCAIHRRGIEISPAGGLGPVQASSQRPEALPQRDAASAANLASALVRVARLNACHETPELALALVENSVMENDADLAARVERLLRDPGDFDAHRPARSRWRMAGYAAGFIGLALIAQPALGWVHAVLERLMD